MYGFVCFQSLLIITCNNKSTVSLLICRGEKEGLCTKNESILDLENLYVLMKM